MRDRDVHAFLLDAATCLRAPAPHREGSLRFGVDLGTATIVVTAIDNDFRPIYWNFLPCEAVRDGVVVHFAEAVAAVRALASEAALALGVEVARGRQRFSPGVAEAEARACRYVLENAGVTCRRLVDEISAAQALLQISDGAIVDVGGGSTGVGVVVNSELMSLTDAPGRRSSPRSDRRRGPSHPNLRGGAAQARRRTRSLVDIATWRRAHREFDRQTNSADGPSRPCISSAAPCASPTPPKSSDAISDFARSATRIPSWSRLSA